MPKWLVAHWLKPLNVYVEGPQRSGGGEVDGVREGGGPCNIPLESFGSGWYGIAWAGPVLIWADPS